MFNSVLSIPEVFYMSIKKNGMKILVHPFDGLQYFVALDKN